MHSADIDSKSRADHEATGGEWIEIGAWKCVSSSRGWSMTNERALLGARMGFPCCYKRTDRQICHWSPGHNSRVCRHPCRGSRWANQILLKYVIIGRYDRKEESEDTHSAKRVHPTHTPRYSEARECPASKSCQTHEKCTGVYTCPHAPKPRNNLILGPFGSEERLCRSRFRVKRQSPATLGLPQLRSYANRLRLPLPQILKAPAPRLTCNRAQV